MDTFENNDMENQPIVPQEEQPAPQEDISRETAPQEAAPLEAAPQAEPDRRESPFADSPYVIREPQQQAYQPQQQPPEKPKKKKKASSGWGRRILASALTLALVAGGCLITAAAVNEHWEDRTEDTVEMLNDKIQALQDQIDTEAEAKANAPLVSPDGAMTPVELYAKCVNSVVAISSTVRQNTPYGINEGYSSGSGFILSADGYVVTNYHVVENASTVEVVTHDGSTYPATVVGGDASNDIAVLKVEAEGLPAAAIGRSSDLSIGDMVVAIGNPLGTLASTQTVGYVSGINREVRTDNTIISMIQTDAAINPGNSGGPLFNMKGEVIGITTAKYSGTTGSGASIEGIGFAIPIDDVAGMISDLAQYGYITGAYMGVVVQNMDPDIVAAYGLPSGLTVKSVSEGGAAQRAGIQPKDIIIALDDVSVTSSTELKRVLRNYEAGDTATITILRGGEKKVLEITFDNRPAVMPDPNAPAEGPMPSEGDYEDWYNFFFGDK